MAARLVGVAALLAAGLVGPLAGEVAAGTATAYGGRAIALQFSTFGGPPVTLGDTGELPSSGGARSEHVFSTSGVANAKLLQASVVGAGDSTMAQASVADLSISIAGNSISADFVGSQASATCGPQAPFTAGGAHLNGLTVNGNRVPVGTQSNQRVSITERVYLVVNEQHRAPDAIVVNALHLYVEGIADLVVASARASVVCVTPAPTPAVCLPLDSITGGGWIQSSASGAKANFSIAARNDGGRLSGHLNFIDHGLRLKVRGSSITAYSATGPASRHIEGTAQIDGRPGTFSADVADNGAGSSDTFNLRLSTGYATSGSLRGGNIQLHVNACI